MANRVRIKDEERARIVLSRERDIDKRLAEKERIDSQLEMYMRKSAEITGEMRLVDNSYRGKRRVPVRSGKLICATLAAIFVFVGVLVLIKLFAGG